MGNQFKNVATMACMKTLLMIFNIVFWCSGIVMAALGLWAEVKLYKYMELSPEFSGTAPYVMIGIGVLIVFVSAMACTCTLKGQPVLLYVYGGFLACILMMEIGVGVSIACYKDTFAKGLLKGLSNNVNNYNSSDVEKSADFMFAQSTLHCCGVHNYTDWLNTAQKAIPLSCCKDESACVTTAPDQIYNKGCYEVIVEYLQQNINLIAGIAIGISLLPIPGIVLSCCLASYVKKFKYDVMN